MAFTYLKVKSAKCLCLLPVVLVLLFRSWYWSCKQRPWSWSCYFGLDLKNLVLFASLPDLLACGACCPSPRTPPRSRPSASIFGPTGLIWQPLPSLHFSQCIGVLIKTMVVPIFGAKECIRMQDFVLKIYKKNPGSRPPDPGGGRGDICSPPTPVPTCQTQLGTGVGALLLGWLRPCRLLTV